MSNCHAPQLPISHGFSEFLTPHHWVGNRKSRPTNRPGCGTTKRGSNQPPKIKQTTSRWPRHCTSPARARPTRRLAPSGPSRGACAASAFSTVNRFSMAPLYGRVWRLAAQHGGSRPGQRLEKQMDTLMNKLANLTDQVSSLKSGVGAPLPSRSGPPWELLLGPKKACVL